MRRFRTLIPWTGLLPLAGWLTVLPLSAQRPPSPMNTMDHGPFVTSTIAGDPLSTRSIFVYKGIAVKVGEDKDAVMVFDTDLLRMASGWTGGFLKWYPERDGLEKFPGPDGFNHFSIGQRPGWSPDGRFDDPRPWKYGPIPLNTGAYRGLYLNEDQVVFSYTIGQSQVLEAPGFQRMRGQPVFTRTFNLGSGRRTLSLLLAEVPDGNATVLEQRALSSGTGYVKAGNGRYARLIGYKGLPAASRFSLDDRHLVLHLPAGEASLRFEVALGPVLPDSQNSYLDDYLAGKPGIKDMGELRKPGPARWRPLTTKIRTGTDDGPFAVDELTLPDPNPWNSFLRFSGVDFLSDGRAVLTCLSGEVWIVDGLEAGSDTLTWTRFATGLYQPHGVKVVDDVIYVTGRDQITRLHDRNQDGEADFYECFNNQVLASENFHAFTMNLDTDSKGNFYFAKATPWPPFSNGVDAEITPHHGVLFRMPPDGSRLDVIASGLRNPNGLSIGPNDEILYSDNEGNWVPTSKVHRIQTGGFHGFMPSAHRDPLPSDFEKPILWVPHFLDNSPSTPIVITSPAWPEELRGQLLLTSYGRGTLSLVLKEEVEGQWQGTHLTLPLKFQSGTIHGRFHQDGHLYIGGLTSWQSVGHGGDWGSFHRVRHTGKPLHMPVAVKTRKGALELCFAEPLDPSVATGPNNYKLRQWTYPWTSQYGTRGKVYSINHPGQPGPDSVFVNSIQLSGDGKTVTLEIPSLRQDLVRKTLGVLPGLPDMMEVSMGMVLAINYRLRSSDGTEMTHALHKTIHRVAGDEATPNAGPHSTPGALFPANDVRSSPTSLAAKPIAESIDLSGAKVVDMESTGIALSFSVTDIRMKAGERLVIRYKNASEMTHNVVIVKTEEDINPVGIAALSAQADGYIPATLNPRSYFSQEQDRILAATQLAYPGDTVMLEFNAPGPGTYPYICTYSGHFTMMQGRIHVDP